MSPVHLWHVGSSSVACGQWRYSVLASVLVRRLAGSLAHGRQRDRRLASHCSLSLSITCSKVCKNPCNELPALFRIPVRCSPLHESGLPQSPEERNLLRPVGKVIEVGGRLGFISGFPRLSMPRCPSARVTRAVHVTDLRQSVPPIHFQLKLVADGPPLEQPHERPQAEPRIGRYHCPGPMHTNCSLLIPRDTRASDPANLSPFSLQPPRAGTGS